MIEKTPVEVVVVGHVCLDIIPTLGSHQRQPSELFVPGKLNRVGPATVTTGGVVPNTGIALHRLGVATRLVGKVGNDALGKSVLEVIGRQGAHLADSMIVSDEVDTSYTVVISPPGVDRMFLHCSGANDHFTADDMDAAWLDGIRLLHFGYPPLMRQMVENDGAEVVKLFERARTAGAVTSLDMAYVDPQSEAANVDWPALLRRVLPHTDLFLPSLEEILYMLGRPQADLDGNLLGEVAQTCLDMGAAVVLLKLGDRGLYMRTTSDAARLRQAGDLPETWRGRELFIPSFDVHCVGATGAGDCAIAGFLAGFVAGESPEEVITTAAAVGACNVEFADAISGIPDLSAVQKRIQSGWLHRPLDLELPNWEPLPDSEVLQGPNSI